MSGRSLPYVCEILKVLVTRHGYGSRFSKDVVVNLAAVPSSDLGDAKDTFEELRTSPEFPFVTNHGPNVISINNSEFGELIDYLHYECDRWDEFELRMYFDHYEGWGEHDFTD